MERETLGDLPGETPMGATASGTQPLGMAGALSRPLVVSDYRRSFPVLTALSWVGLVALPLVLSVALDRAALGAPLLGVALWLALLRMARWVSPKARADALLRRGKYAAALAMCDEALAVRGDGAWVGSRRLVWLNRRVAALLGLGRADEAVVSALEALAVSADPETLAGCGLALLRLNRYEEALEPLRRVAAVTRARSVSANATMAMCLLARERPADAEALAVTGLADLEALSPFMRTESQVACLAALCGARAGLRRFTGPRGAWAALEALRRAARRWGPMRAVTLLEEAALALAAPDGRDVAQVRTLVRQAYGLAPGYARWRLTQPDLFAWAAEDAGEVGALAREAAETLRAQAEAAPPAEVVSELLGMASPVVRAQPASQSSGSVLAAQIVTVAATLGLLFLWMWHFFLTTGGK